jgi:hypothetical protein
MRTSEMHATLLLSREGALTMRHRIVQLTMLTVLTDILCVECLALAGKKCHKIDVPTARIEGPTARGD